MLKASFNSAEEDKSARMLAEARVSAGAIISAVSAALEADSTLISQEQVTVIQAEIQRLVATSATNNTDAIHAGVEALNHATEEFAAARMNASVSRALAGKTLDEIKL
jgi:molecular chaperone HscA